MNGIFGKNNNIIVELKTLYGYSTDIFAKVSDARNGTLVHIDIRSPYSTPGSVHIADANLANRVLNGIIAAIEYQSMKYAGTLSKITKYHDDYVVGPSNLTGELSYLLGPPANNIYDTCKKILIYSNYRKDVLKGHWKEYCGACNED